MLSSCLERKAHLERKAESIKLKAKLFGLGIMVYLNAFLLLGACFSFRLFAFSFRLSAFQLSPFGFSLSA